MSAAVGLCGRLWPRERPLAAAGAPDSRVDAGRLRPALPVHSARIRLGLAGGARRARARLAHVRPLGALLPALGARGAHEGLGAAQRRLAPEHVLGGRRAPPVRAHCALRRVACARRAVCACKWLGGRLLSLVPLSAAQPGVALRRAARRATCAELSPGAARSCRSRSAPAPAALRTQSRVRRCALLLPSGLRSGPVRRHHQAVGARARKGDVDGETSCWFAYFSHIFNTNYFFYGYFKSIVHYRVLYASTVLNTVVRTVHVCHLLYVCYKRILKYCILYC